MPRWWRKLKIWPTPDQAIDLDPTVRDAWGLPAPRLTYDWRRPNEVARVAFMQKKMEDIGHAMGGNVVWRGPLAPGLPGAHHEGGTRMGNDPNTSVVNKYGQSWDIPNLFVVGSLDFPIHERVQSDADDPGARLYERRRHCDALQTKPWPAAVGVDGAIRSKIGSRSLYRSATTMFVMAGFVPRLSRKAFTPITGLQAQAKASTKGA